MAALPSGPLSRNVGELFSAGTLGSMSDAHLLSRFSSRQGETAEAAFAALVARHGPMVLRVCRILVGDRHEAEDAFQATFLVLARKAARLRNPDRLASWLYGVAHRTARKTRSSSARRRMREATLVGPAEDELATRDLPLDLALARQEEARLVHRELEKLSEKHRVVMVLCEIQELTIEEAANRLQCTPDAVRGRLARARTHLRLQLARRGLEVPAAVMAASLCPSNARAGAAALNAGTTQAAVAFARGSHGGISEPVLVIAREVLRPTVAIRDGAAVMLLVTGLFGGAIVIPLALQVTAGGGLGKKPGIEVGGTQPGPGQVDRRSGPRRLVEELDWSLSAVELDRRRISVKDPGAGRDDSIALTATTSGLRPIGVSLSNLILSPDARITIDGAPAKLKDLKPGTHVRLRLDPDRFTVIEIRASASTASPFLYRIEEVDPDERSMTVALPERQISLAGIRVAPDARIERISSRTVNADGDSVVLHESSTSLRALRPGMFVSLSLVVTDEGGLVVDSIRAGAGNSPGGKNP